MIAGVRSKMSERVIIRDEQGRCVTCRRFVCTEVHEETEEAKAVREEKEAEEFAEGFLL